MVSLTKNNIIKLIIIVFLLSTCSRKAISNNTPTEIKASDLTVENINFFIKGESVNFINEKIDKIIKIMGKPEKIEDLGGNENGRIARGIYDGFSVEYYVNSRILRKIIIEKKDYSIINGVGIGSLKKDVEKYLIGGIPITQNNSYLFIYFNPDTDQGIGYDIYYDSEEKIQQIIIGLFSFGP